MGSLVFWVHGGLEQVQAGEEKQHLLQGMCSLNIQAKQRVREMPWFYRTEAYKTSVTHPRLWEEFSKVRKRV